MRRWLVVVLALGCSPSGDPAEDTDTDATTGPMPSTSSSGPSSTGQRWEQTVGCQLWLECLDPDDRDALLAEYGPTGTCWQGNARLVEECDATCSAGRDDDCEQTMDSDSGPDPDVPPDVEECALETLAPGAVSWVVAGEGADVLPTEIGEILDRNCSCHVTELEEFGPLVPLYEGALRFTTHAEFHANWQGNPVYVKVDERTFDTLSMPPLYYCGDGDYGSSIHSPDFEIFAAWLEAEAPDAALWAELRPDDLP